MGVCIRESVDYVGMARTCNTCNNFTTNTLNAYLSTQASPLSAFVISKTHISGQTPCGRQLNTKVCGSESAIFHILVVKTTMFNNDISQTV